MQLIIAKQGDLQDENKKIIGKRCRIRIEKNTFGPHGRVIGYELRTDYKDKPGEYWDRVISMDEPMCKWLLDDKLLDVSVTESGLWSCPSLGILGQTATNVTNALSANEAATQKLGQHLRIEGYFDPIAEINEAEAASAAKKEKAKTEEHVEQPA